jgi:hypothetical protein
MTHPINTERADAAATALATYGGTTKDKALDDLTDFLSDLMHLCDREGIDLDKSLRTARNHYYCESDKGDDIEQSRRRLWEAENKTKGGPES